MNGGTESLFDKLKSYGVQVERKNIQPPPQVAPPIQSPAMPPVPPPVPPPALPPDQPRRYRYGIERVIDGTDIETAFGTTFLTQQLYPSGYRHGCIDLCSECSLEALAAWGATPRLADPSLRNILFLDTETTGLAGGTGTLVFLVGLGYHDVDGFHLAQIFLRGPEEEKAFLYALERWAAPFEAIVTFNGKSFDLPLVQTRFTMNQFSSSLGSMDHLDLLQLARKLWRDRLASRALGDLEKEIIRFQRSHEDIPGWMIPDLYFDYLRNGDARQLAGVFYHNAMDIVTMSALFHHVAGLLTEPAGLLETTPWVGSGAGLDLAAVARLYEGLGWLDKAAQLYDSSLERGLPETFFYKTIERYAQMERRQGRWEQAVRLWERAAERGQYQACIELAKYYEHKARQYDQALQWVQRAGQMAHRAFRYDWERREALKELAARAERLERKKK